MCKYLLEIDTSISLVEINSCIENNYYDDHDDFGTCDGDIWNVDNHDDDTL